MVWFQTLLLRAILVRFIAINCPETANFAGCSDILASNFLTLPSKPNEPAWIGLRVYILAGYLIPPW